jgi:hypothetical protein
MMGEDIDLYCAPVYDTQVYQGHIVSGGGSDSDDDFDLKIEGDSEPPTDSDNEQDDSEDDGSPMVVSHTANPTSAKEKRGRASQVLGGAEKTWDDMSREFVSYLSSVKLPI